MLCMPSGYAVITFGLAVTCKTVSLPSIVGILISNGVAMIDATNRRRAELHIIKRRSRQIILGE